MVKLLDILKINNPKEAERIASDIFKSWSKERFSKERLELFEFGFTTYKKELEELGYGTYYGMDYEHMEEMPEKINFIFDTSGEDYGNYFTDDLYKAPKIVLPGQPDENLTSIVLGKRSVWTPKEQDETIEDSVYICMQWGARIGQHHAVKGNEPVNIPILYGSIKEHIQILIPNNLAYFK